MHYERPTWADDLTNLMTGMSKGGPKPLLQSLALFAGAEVSSDEFSEFVSAADENDTALTQLRLAMASWDANETDAMPDESGAATAPHTAARRQATYVALGLGSAATDAIGARIPLFEKPVIVISKEFEPWYEEARKKRTSVYWDDYERYLRDTKKWSANAIASLDETTTDVVERLSDPTRATVKQTKGLVVGYVQSGKTANFTGVAAKAIDAGYRLIIVLTGTLEILRAQTQRRMDMELMGVENILAGLDPGDPAVAKELDYQQDEDYVAGRFIRHGSVLNQPGVVHISRVTTHRSDYKRLPQGLTKLRFQRTDKQRPLNDAVNLFNADAYVAVIKKNSAPLKQLIKDLTPLKSDLGQLPVLVIDDESDQASVDTTNPAKINKTSDEDRKRTAINKLITEILRLCPRAQYVGYTATPFANVFVDPDDERDLFPSDFVLSLQRPPGYMGVREFHDVGRDWDAEDKTFANSNELAHVRTLVGDADRDPMQRNSELQEALDAWVLSGAIKKFRESAGHPRYRHHTMLVHESVRQADHFATAADVRGLWKTSKFTQAVGLARLEELYRNDFQPVMNARADGQSVPPSFDALKPFVARAFQEMTSDGDPVLVVNSDQTIKEQQKKLDFEAEQVWRILVGGTQLSRGFTVEGLTVSYFRRNAGQADTLMQAGRWFGFRPGYQDLVRLYIRRDQSVDLYEAFEALLMDEEAFREELRQYEGFGEDGTPLVEPRLIPPLVSQHLPWLKPTARNKMWNAVIESKATARGFQDLFGLPPRGDSSLKETLERVGLPLLAAASDHARYSDALGAKIGLMDAQEFLDLLTKATWHSEFLDVVTPLERFLKNSTALGRIADWAIVWPQPTRCAGYIDMPAIGHAPVIKRSRRDDRNSFVGSDSKHRAAALPIARGEDVSGVPSGTGRGVVIVYLVDDRAEGSTDPLSLDNVVPLLSIAAPASATPHKRDLIQWVVRVKGRDDDAAVEIVASPD